MKSFLILVGFFVVVAYADREAELAKVLKQSKECETKLEEPKNLIEKLINKEDIGDETKAGVMALCINSKLGHMDDKGLVIKDKFVEHVHNLTDDEDQRKKLIDECGEKKGNTAEEAALKFTRCMT